MFLLKRAYFNRTLIIKGLITAILFSSALYLSYFSIENKILNTIFALLSLYFILKIPRISLFHAGFFIGLFWFYWISFSFGFYGLSYLVPFVILGIALISAFLFLATAIIDKTYMRAAFVFGLSYIEPFGFNWLKIELLFVDSFFDVSKVTLALILLSVLLLVYNRLLLFTIPVIVAFFLQTPSTVLEPELKIALPDYSFKQDYKWNKKNLNVIIEKNLEQIDTAIKENYDVVVLPETTFPLLLNKEFNLLNKLSLKSKEITIIAGGLYFEKEEYRNSTYIFKNEVLKIAHKVVLVPFGEAVPLPEKLKNLINDTFYDGSSDYTKASKPTNFEIEGSKFRNAICYEATKDEIYENLDDVKYIIATSNNAWFTPSIEPTLQKRMMKFYAKKNNIIIYHQANGSANEVIKPY